MPSRITFIVITNASEKRLIDLSQAPVPIGRIIDPQADPSSSSTPVASSLNHLRFNSKVVSRNHARVSEKDGKIYLQDTKSSSGTFLNGIRISGPGQESELREMKCGDIIRLGEDYNLDGVIHQAIVLKVIFPAPTIKGHVDQQIPMMEQRHQQNFESIVYPEDDLPLRSGSQQSTPNMTELYNEVADVEANIKSEFNNVWRTLTQDIPTPLERLRRLQTQMQKQSTSSRTKSERSSNTPSSSTLVSPMTATDSSPKSRGSSVSSHHKFPPDTLPTVPIINVEHHHRHDSSSKERTAGKILNTFRRKLSRERIISSPGTISTPTLPSPSDVDLANSSVNSLVPDYGFLPRTRSNPGDRRETYSNQDLLQPDLRLPDSLSSPQLDGYRNPSSSSSSSTTSLSYFSATCTSMQHFSPDPASTLGVNSANSLPNSSPCIPSNSRATDKKNSIQPYPPAPNAMKNWTERRSTDATMNAGLIPVRSTKGGGMSEYPSVEECCKFIENLGSWPNVTVQFQLLELAKQQDESVMELCTKFRHFPKAFVDVASQYAISKLER